MSRIASAAARAGYLKPTVSATRVAEVALTNTTPPSSFIRPTLSSLFRVNWTIVFTNREGLSLSSLFIAFCGCCTPPRPEYLHPHQRESRPRRVARCRRTGGHRATLRREQAHTPTLPSKPLQEPTLHHHSFCQTLRSVIPRSAATRDDNQYQASRKRSGTTSTRNFYSLLLLVTSFLGASFPAPATALLLTDLYCRLSGAVIIDPQLCFLAHRLRLLPPFLSKK